MPSAELDEPRAPGAAPGTPLYESHYLTATAPEGGRAVWLRYTADKHAGGPPEGTLWCTAFTSGRAPVQRREAVAGRLAVPPAGVWARIGESEIAPGRATGGVADCRWDVTWTAEAEPVPYLPARFLYDRSVPRSNGVALVPSARLAGTVDVAGEPIDLTGWRGMVGHNWGRDHAEQWVWLHAGGLADRDGDGWFDLVLARVRLGPLLTPWIATGALQLDGERRALGGPATALRGVRVEDQGERLRVELPGGVLVETTSPATDTATWDYASPAGPGRLVRNCSIADGTITLSGRTPLEVRGGFAVELGRPAG